MYQISQLLVGLGNPVTADPDEPIREALNKMLRYGFSQLPVVKGADQQRQFYLVTFESILVALHNFGSTLDSASLRVEDALVKVSVYSSTDDLFELLAGMRDMNAALIVDADRNLTHVVTSYDTSQYFRQWAEDIMQVRDVEHSLRRIVNSAFRGPDGLVNEAARKVAIEEITPSNRVLRKKFAAAVRQYLAAQSAGGVSVRVDWLDLAFAELLKPRESAEEAESGPKTASNEAPSMCMPRPEDEPVVVRLLASAVGLRERLQAAIHSYLIQTLMARDPDESLLETAFPLLQNRKEEGKDFNQLTLDEYIQLFFNSACWGRCKAAIRLEEQEFRHMLEGVRDTRNMLAHFREDEITAQRRQQLKACAGWLGERERLIVRTLGASDVPGETAGDAGGSAA